MTSRNVLALVIVAVLVLATGLWLAGRQASTTARDDGAPLYRALETQLDAITAVRIFKAGDERAVELKRGESGWTVTERSGYRADEAKLRRLVRAIADAEPMEEKTSNPERYAALGVEDTSAKDATGVRVELAGPGEPVNLIVGKTGRGASSRYVRRAGDEPSWLVDQAIEAPTDPGAWLANEIADIPAERVQSVKVSIKGEKPYTAVKASRDEEIFSVEGLPKGKSLRSPTIANGVASALSGLTLTDVRAMSAFGQEPAADHATFRTFDGLVVELSGWKQDDKRFVALEASFDGAAAKAAEPKVEEEAKSIAARSAGWVYEIPGYRYESLFKPVGELL